MSRDLLTYTLGYTLAVAGVSGLIATGNQAYVLKRTIYPQGASVFVSGVSTATLGEMFLLPSSFEVNGPAPLFFRSTGASGAVNIVTGLSQGATQVIGY